MRFELHGYLRNGDIVTLYMTTENNGLPFKLDIPYCKAAQKIMDKCDRHKYDVMHRIGFLNAEVKDVDIPKEVKYDSTGD